MDNRHIDQNSQVFFEDSSSLPNDYFSALEQYPAAEVVSRLAQNHWNEQRAIALSLGDDCRINVTPRTIKTIGIYYCQIGCGGADRVVLDQAKTLSNLGYHIVLITETPLEDDVFDELPDVSHVLLSPFFWDTSENLYPQRARALERCLIEHAIDMVVYNQSLSPLMLWDLLIIKAHSVSCIAWAHGIFTFPLAEVGKANGVDRRIADMP
ncbi:MAG: glycosyltransferase family 4 protein, partial [Raoultibacter sp.]